MRRTALVFGCLLAAAGYCPKAQAHPGEQGGDAGGARPLSFFGGFTSHEFSNPGLHLGAEYALATTPHFQSLATASFQAYHQRDTETGYALHTRWGHRYTANFGFTFDSYLGIGLQYTRYVATVFEFHDSVASAKDSSTHCLAFAPHVVFGPGYDFERRLKVPLHLYARPGIMLLYPDLNEAFQASVVAELGVRWTPKL